MTYVLVVDDEEPVRRLLRDVLEMDDYEVDESPDGFAALASIERRNPDCIVLDVMMPGMSGIEVLTDLRARDFGADVPVLMLTAAGDDGTTWAGWQAGASYYLPKPFDVDHLLTWVGRLIDLHRINIALADVAMVVTPRRGVQPSSL